MCIRDRRLLSFPNVVMTSHQGFFTKEALTNIAETTLENAKAFMDGNEQMCIRDSLKTFLNCREVVLRNCTTNYNLFKFIRCLQIA